MRLMPRIISAGFATCALASAALPALSWNTWSESGVEVYSGAGVEHAARDRATEVALNEVPNRRG